MRRLIATLAFVALGSAAAAPLSPAAARINLSQCISNNHACTTRYYVNSPAPPGSERFDLNLKNCLNLCAGNHAACVDSAMSMGAMQVGPKKPPRGVLGVGVSPAGILDGGPGFMQQGPAATGSPAGGGRPAAAPSAPPVIIR